MGILSHDILQENVQPSPFEKNMTLTQTWNIDVKLWLE